MKDYVANPQIKYLAEIIDVLLSGADLREKDWTFDKRSAIAHSRFFFDMVNLLNQSLIGAVINFKVSFTVKVQVLNFKYPSNKTILFFILSMSLCQRAGLRGQSL